MPKSFLDLRDFTKDEIKEYLDFALKEKAAYKNGKINAALTGKCLGMIFEKPSNRTRLSFEVGMYQLGGKSIYIQAAEIGMGKRESIADVARVLSRYLDCIMIRAKAHEDIVGLAKYAAIPVINGLSDVCHPCQAMADMMTILEKKPLEQNVCYIGDGNNVCRSLVVICGILGIKIKIACPEGYEPDVDVDKYPYTVVRDPLEAVKGCNVLYTDVWTSMGQEEEAKQRRNDFKNYTVTKDMLNKAAKDAVFMHCLPAKRGEEVTDEVMESSSSVVFDQAENRMHVQKAILLKLLPKS
jgi:ornithine carbamoyltransferase